VTTLSPALEAKRLGLLRELVPQAAIVAVLLNPTNPDADLQRRDVHPTTKRPDCTILVSDCPSTNKDLGVVEGTYSNWLAETRQAGIELPRNPNVVHETPC